MALAVEICPETGICSIFREDGKKVDLMPDEVEAIREAPGDLERIRTVLAECDTQFTANLSADALTQIGQELR